MGVKCWQKKSSISLTKKIIQTTSAKMNPNAAFFFSFGFFVVIFWKFEKRSENGSNGAIIIIKQKWAIRIIKKILPVLEWRIVLLPPHPDPSPIYSLITDNDDCARATTYPAKPKIGHSCCTTITLSYTSCRTLVFVNKKQSLIKKKKRLSLMQIRIGLEVALSIFLIFPLNAKLGCCAGCCRYTLFEN